MTSHGCHIVSFGILLACLFSLILVILISQNDQDFYVIKHLLSFQYIQNNQLSYNKLSFSYNKK